MFRLTAFKLAVVVILIFQFNAGHTLPRIIAAMHGNEAKNMATRMRLVSAIAKNSCLGYVGR